MRKVVQQEVARCPTCIVHSRRQIHDPMGDMPIVCGQGQFISADLIGPFMPSQQGNKHVLTTIDLATVYAQAYAKPSKTN